MLLVKCNARPSPIHGRGLFASADIPKGTHLYRFEPGFDHKEPLGGQSKDMLHFGYVSTTDGMFIDCGDDAKWWNFGMPPNCAEIDEWINGERIVVAICHIPSGTELLIDTNTDLDSSRKLML